MKKKTIIWLIVIAAIVAAGFFMFFRNGNGTEEILVVRPGDFIQQVSVSGTVVPAQDVDLSFTESGRVASIPVKIGDRVENGQALVSIAIGTLGADLQAAQADLAQRRAEASNTADNVDEVRKQQDTLVESAYREMLSEDLVAVPHSSNVTATAPVVTGLYSGKEGTYKIRITSDLSGSNDYELRTFDLETSGPVEILENDPTPLGTKGLFISFPDDLRGYSDTIWYITIPNVKSASYKSHFNAYQEALRMRDKEIADAEAELTQSRGETTVSAAAIARAQAEVSRIQTEIAERTLRAPFAGVITDIKADVGGIAGANDIAVSLISDSTLQIESFVPEIHIPFLKIGDPAVVTLDAYGVDVSFDAEVIAIDPAETIRDGVSTYRAIFEFSDNDDRVRAGMTANLTVTTEKKSNVISVPRGIVIERDGKKFVPVKDGEDTVEREVTLGSISSLGQVEIVSGLTTNDRVVLTPTDE